MSNSSEPKTRTFNKVIVFGASSAIAIAVARNLAQPDVEFVLVGRDEEKLKLIAQDLAVRQATAQIVTCDLGDLDGLPKVVEQAFITGSAAPQVDFCLVAHGVLSSGDTPKERSDFTAINFLSPALITELAAKHMTAQSSGGVIGVISSVAGERGRRSNYWYGSTKGALTTILSGLRSAYSGSQVHILTIKPGFVDTPMTSHISKGPLFASADRVGADIVRAAIKRRNVCYTPWFWQPIMRIICAMPEVVFKRLPL